MHKIILILNKGASIPYLKLLHLNNYFMLRKQDNSSDTKKGAEAVTQAATNSQERFHINTQPQLYIPLKTPALSLSPLSVKHLVITKHVAKHVEKVFSFYSLCVTNVPIFIFSAPLLLCVKSLSVFKTFLHLKFNSHLCSYFLFHDSERVYKPFLCLLHFLPTFLSSI